MNTKIIDALKPILEQYDNAIMSFVVSVTDSGKRIPRIWVVSFQFYDDVLRMMLKREPANDSIRSGDEIFTSIQFHCPPFNLKM